MPHYVIYRASDGRAVSHTTVEPQNLAIGNTYKMFAEKPDNTMWDESTLAFIPIPPKQYVNRLVTALSNPAFDDLQEAYQALSPALKTKIRNGLERLLGDKVLMRVGSTIVIKD